VNRRLAPSRLQDGDVAWLGVFAGPLAWMFDQQASYALTPLACNRGLHWPLYLSSAFALALVLLGGFFAWRDRARPGPVPAEGAERPGRARFLGTLGLLTALLFAVVILSQLAAKFLLDPCQR
jgi:hypothetical protein